MPLGTVLWLLPHAHIIFAHILCSHLMLTSHAHVSFLKTDITKVKCTRVHSSSPAVRPQTSPTRAPSSTMTFTGSVRPLPAGSAPFVHTDAHMLRLCSHLLLLSSPTPGTIASHDGSIYQGQFRHGQYHGVGSLRTIGEEEYDERGVDAGGDGGKGKGSKMESVYTGDFSEGLFHGCGSLTHSDGSSYVGTWREG